MIRRLPQLKNIKLDIGCGKSPIKGYVGMDVYDCGQEILWDARHGIPFPNESIEEIHTSHFLEHLSDDEFIDFLQECMRVLKHKGLMKNRLPHSSHPTAFFVGHKAFWNEWRVEALLRQREPVQPFLIEDNRQVGSELVFVLKKI